MNLGTPLISPAPPRAPTRQYLLLTAASVALFAASLTQPAFFLGASQASTAPALRLLLQGWRGPLHGYLEWLANPALLVSWIAALKGFARTARVAAWLALCLMVGFLLRRSLDIPGGGRVVSYGSGFWLWLGSASLMLAASCSPKMQRRG